VGSHAIFHRVVVFDDIVWITLVSLPIILVVTENDRLPIHRFVSRQPLKMGVIPSSAGVSLVCNSEFG
jgi:hypothetical protein